MLRSASPILRTLNSFWRWWISELVDLVPGRLRALARARDELLIDFSGVSPVVSHLRAGVPRTSVAVSPDTAETGREAVAAATRELPRHREAVIRLPASRAMRKNIEMPFADDATLHRMLAFEIDRQTPYQTDQVIWHARATEQGVRQGRARVTWTVVPRAVVESVTSRVAAWGCSACAVEIIGEHDERPARIDLAAAETGMARRRGAVNGALVALALLLAGASVYVPFTRQKAVLAELQAAVAEARGQAEAASKLRLELERIVTDGQVAAERKREAPSTVRIIDLLTQILPDDTWLSNLQVADREIRIAGVTASSSELVGLIERSQSFRNVRFRAPVTPAPAGGELFNLVFDVAVQPGRENVAEVRR